jgi:uncharacterized protein
MKFLSSGGIKPLFSFAVTTVVAGLGGTLLARIGFPAGWLSGALIAVTALALAGFPASMPDAVRRAVFIVLGISMGTAVTPETIAGIRTWPVTMLFLVLSIPAAMASVMIYLQWAGWDREVSFYSSALGAMSAVIAAATDAGVDVRKVVFAQSVRVFFLIAALPGFLVASGLVTSDSAAAFAQTGTAQWWEIVLMGAGGIAGGLLAERAGVPGGLVVGSMFVNAVLHGTGFVTAAVPDFALIPCFVLLGGFIGARFYGTQLSMLKSLLLHSFGGFLVAMAVSTTFAVVGAWLAGESVAKAIIAFAPGGLEAMIILAFVIGLDPAFVGAHHLVRFILVALFLPLVARALFGRAPND